MWLWSISLVWLLKEVCRFFTVQPQNQQGTFLHGFPGLGVTIGAPVAHIHRLRKQLYYSINGLKFRHHTGETIWCYSTGVADVKYSWLEFGCCLKQTFKNKDF